MTKEEILTFLRENKTLLQEQYHVTKIGLFGSYARDEAHEESDIDILVEMPSQFDLYYDLKEYLETHLHKTIDLGLQKSMRPFIEDFIKKDLIHV